MSRIGRWPKAVVVPGAAVLSAALMSGCVSASPTPRASAPEPSAATAKAASIRSKTHPHAKAAAQKSNRRAGKTALDVLAVLPVKGRAPMTGYDRARFGQAWLDADRNGCDTRNDVLAQRLTNIVYKPGTRDCVVESGDLADHYTSLAIRFIRGNGFLVDVDHVVALGNVWATGGFAWDIKKRAAIANDPMDLEPVDASTNRQKGDGDAATWLPPNKSYRCTYVARQVAVKKKYGLWVTPPEAAAISRVLAACPGQPLPQDSGAPTSVTLNIHDPFTQSTAPSKPTSPGGSVYYANCDAARAAGAAPVHRGDPGYAAHLDRDGDGTGCE